MADKFMHSAEPRSVEANRQSKSAGSKYRETNNQQNEELSQSGNIMFDKRVVRGNTYAAQVLTANAQDERERGRLARERQVLFLSSSAILSFLFSSFFFFVSG
jgi:hypothetical protein